MRHIIFTILLGYALLVTGCAFKNDIQQGNVITTTQLDQLATGMTPQQVQFLLGSPLLIDPFHHQRWDYLYSFRAGEQAEVTRYRATAGHLLRMTCTSSFTISLHSRKCKELVGNEGDRTNHISDCVHSVAFGTFIIRFIGLIRKV